MNRSSWIRVGAATICSLFIVMNAHGQARAGGGESSPAQKSAALYQQGLAAENAGDADTARKAYESALSLNPRNANAEYHLGQLRLNFDKIAAKGRKAKFDSIMIPEFKVDDASIADSLQALRILAEKQNGATPYNFILQDPKEKLKQAKVTMVLKQIPAGKVLEYLLEQGGATARFDEHAIVILVK